MYTINLKHIKEKAMEKEKENIEFRMHLKGLDDETVDKVAHKIYKSVAKEIDCKKCANCCKKMSVSVTDDDISHISDYLKISIEDFKTKFIDANKKINLNTNSACIFLKNDKCTIQCVSPSECKSFPHIHKESFNSRSSSMLDFYGICPIVYNILERMKKEMKFPENSNVPKGFLDMFENDNRQFIYSFI